MKTPNVPSPVPLTGSCSLTTPCIGLFRDSAQRMDARVARASRKSRLGAARHAIALMQAERL